MKSIYSSKAKVLKLFTLLILVNVLFSIKLLAQNGKPYQIKPLGAYIGVNYTNEFANNLSGLDFSLAVQLSKKSGHRIIGTFGVMSYGNWDMFNVDYPPNNGYYGYGYGDIKFMYNLVKHKKLTYL